MRKTKLQRLSMPLVRLQYSIVQPCAHNKTTLITFSNNSVVEIPGIIVNTNPKKE